MVASLVTLFKKLKFGTDENVGWGPIDLPELELQTTASWLTVGPEAAAGPGGTGGATSSTSPCVGAGRAIQTVASVLLMVDPRDLGLVTQVRSPHQEAPTIYLYEAVPGGVGLTRAPVRAADELVDGAAELIAALRVRVRLPGLHGSPARARRRRQGPRPAPARRARRRRSPRTPSSPSGHDRRRPPRTPPRRSPPGARRRPGDCRRRGRPARRRPGRGPPAGGARPGARRSAPSDWPPPSTASGSVGPPAATSGSRSPPIELPIDRERLGRLPDGRRPDVPLVCLDTETTGLATGTGTVAWLVGLGRWHGDRFRQVQLMLPDHAEEPALLEALATLDPRRCLARDLQRAGLRLAPARRRATG